MLKWVALSAAAVLGIASITQAAPKELVDPVSGTSSGWTWDVSAAVEPLVNLVFIRSEGNNFFIEKDAEIKNVSDPIVITFNKIGGANAKTLVINDEAVFNNSGVDWTAFRMELSSGSSGGTPNFAFQTSDGSSGRGDFAIDPFTTFAFASSNTQILLGGGTVKAGSTWFPGSQSNTGLSIVANGTDSSFTLKEIANPGTQPTPIPLPSAAWTGLSGLLGLGLVAGFKKARRRLA